VLYLKKKYKDLSTSKAKRLKMLEEEKKRLKETLAERISLTLISFYRG